MHMKIVSVEVLTEDAFERVRRHARRERQAERERFAKTTMRDVIDLFHQDLSQLGVRLTDGNSQTNESPLPPVPSDQVLKYEKADAIALLFHARAAAGKPVLVEFSGDPSKKFESDLPGSAKNRNLVLRFYRLCGPWAIVKVYSKETPKKQDMQIS